MHFIATMDPTNPRWETSEERTKRSATIWKIIVAAAGASALTAVIVASCLDRDEARRGTEPAFVETTSVTAVTPPAAQPVAPVRVTPAPATRDSTGGVASGAADDSAPSATANGATTSTTTVTSAPLATQVQPRQMSYSPVTVPFESANGDTSTSGTNGTGPGTNGAAGPNAGPNGSNINPPTNGATDAASLGVDAGPNAGHASHLNNDPNNRGSNPQSPPMSAGAGRFVTEAPYWGASAWTSDPNAGAGPFTTERNTPAYGTYGVVGEPAPPR